MSDTPSDPRHNDPSWKNQYDLLDYLMEFVNTNNEVLPILAGYFSKVLISLFSNKRNLLSLYLYSHTNLAMENIA